MSNLSSIKFKEKTRRQNCIHGYMFKCIIKSLAAAQCVHIDNVRGALVESSSGRFLIAKSYDIVNGGSVFVCTPRAPNKIIHCAISWPYDADAPSSSGILPMAGALKIHLTTG